MFSRKKSTTSAADQDWVINTSNMIEGVIDRVRDGAVVKLTTLVRAIVYGALLAIVGVTALVLLTIVFVRMLDIYLDYIAFLPENVWLADFVAGAIFIVLGLFVWSKRSPKHAAAKDAR